MSASEKEEDQRIPLYLSSATSAEYGNLQSLSRRIASGKLNAASLPGVAADPLSVVSGRTNGGITPLHLAAQHGQLGAVTMLLRESGCGVDTGLVESGACSPVSEGGNACGATPLHRAAFSGAVGCMFALITWRRGDVAEGRGGGGSSSCARCGANLLASDTSFGDEKTPLQRPWVEGGHLPSGCFWTRWRTTAIWTRRCGSRMHRVGPCWTTDAITHRWARRRQSMNANP